MKWYTYENNFHNTQARSRYSEEELHYALMTRECQEPYPTREQRNTLRAAQRVVRALCGIRGCVCSGDLGTRP